MDNEWSDVTNEEAGGPDVEENTTGTLRVGGVDSEGTGDHGLDGRDDDDGGVIGNPGEDDNVVSGPEVVDGVSEIPGRDDDTTDGPGGDNIELETRKPDVGLPSQPEEEKLLLLKIEDCTGSSL